MARGALPPGGDALLSPSPLPELLLGMCPYAVLGILPSDSSSSPTSSTSFFASVTVKAIATAYRKAALRAHPDKNKGREAEAAQEFVRIQAAFSFLSCEDTRSSYHGYLEKKERHEQLLAERRKSHTQADEKKRKLAEDLQRKEEAFLAKKTSWNSSYDRGGGGGRGGNEEDKERLRRIRERNEKLLEEHREQCRTKSSVYDTLKQNKPQKQSSESGYGIGVGGGTGAAPVFSRVDEEEEDLDDLLKRSVYVQWNSDETTPRPATPSGVSSSSSSAGATADGCDHSNLSQKARDADAPSPSSAPTVTPSLLSSLFTPLHALYIYGFTSSSGLVAFATRERAIQSALEFQRQQKALRKSNSSLFSSRKQGQDVKGLAERRESEDSFARTNDSEEEEKARKPLRYRVKLADQVENLKETLRSCKEDTEGEGKISSSRESLKTGSSFSSSSSPGGAKIQEDHLHRWG